MPHIRSPETEELRRSPPPTLSALTLPGYTGVVAVTAALPGTGVKRRKLARSDLLISLVRATHEGDKVMFTRALEALIAEERSKQHHVLADRLAEFLGNGERNGTRSVMPDPRTRNLFFEVLPRRSLTDLILSESAAESVAELIEEQLRRDLLRSHGLEPRHRVLLIGPPGNGKTTLAEAMAEALMVPLIVARYEGIIGSYLGETASRLAALFDHVRTRPCVFFLDEFDTLGKERGDIHETGEIKRVVSSLLLQVDAIPSHVVLVSATNHPELLDRAVWRRFQVRLDLPAPGGRERTEWWRRFEQRAGEPLGLAPSTFSRHTVGASFSDIEGLGEDIMRRRALAREGTSLMEIAPLRLESWRRQVSGNTKPQNRAK